MELFNLLLKFSIAGIAGVLINFCLCIVMKELLNINKYFSNSFSLVIALTVNFFLNRNWAFSKNFGNIVDQSLKFSLVVIVSIVLNHLIVYIFTEKIKMNFYHSKIFAVGLLFIWNFLMHYNFTFV
tara:strand:- start:60 stop:437 length:378 start_codon:yes stop_codon:yes gene_type:complete